MQISLKNKRFNNLENEQSKSKVFLQRYEKINGKGSISRKNRGIRRSGYLLDARSLCRSTKSTSSLASPSLTPIQSSLSDASLNGMIIQGDLSPFKNESILDKQGEQINNSGITNLENNGKSKESQMPEILKMILTGKKDKIKDVTTKDDYYNALKKINPEEFIDCLKNLGEEIFVENKNTTSDKNKIDTDERNNSVNYLGNIQMATPMTTPMDSNFLDETLLSTTFQQQKNMEGNMMSQIPNTPGSISLMNYTLPPFNSDIGTSVIGVMPSPELFSPIQPNLCGTPFIQSTPFEKSEDIVTTPFIQSTPFEKPEDIVATPFVQDIPFIQSTPFISSTPFEKMNDINSTSVLSNGFSDPSVITQDELNPFKTPVAVISDVSGSIEEIKSQVQASSSSSIDTVNERNNSVTGIEEILDSITGSSISNSVINPINSLNDVNVSPIVQNVTTPVQQSPFAFTPENAPLLNNEDISIDTLSDELIIANASTFFGGNNLLGSENSDGDGSSSSSKENDSEKDNSDLEKVNNLILEVLNTISTDSDGFSTKEAIKNCKDSDGFPTKETIKNCKVNENEFNFTNENISKLVHLAPIEVVQEDVIELQKLSKLKRGKGRPRKPRKFSICPFESCQKKFNREFNLKEHIRIHDPNRSKGFCCKLCNECFFSSSVLSRHIASIHKGEKFYCKSSGKSFNRKDALHRHEKTSCIKLQYV